MTVRVVKVGHTVGWRDPRGHWHDAIVTGVTNQNLINLRVPHIGANGGWSAKTGVPRMTAPGDTNVFKKHA